MPVTEAYAEELASLRGLLGEPAPGIHLLEFATIPQLESILSDLRPLCAERECIEIPYDPAVDKPAALIEKAVWKISGSKLDGIPLIFLHPVALPDASNDGTHRIGVLERP